MKIGMQYIDMLFKCIDFYFLIGIFNCACFYIYNLITLSFLPTKILPIFLAMPKSSI